MAKLSPPSPAGSAELVTSVFSVDMLEAIRCSYRGHSFEIRKLTNMPADFADARKLILLADFCAPQEGAPVPFFVSVHSKAAYLIQSASVHSTRVAVEMRVSGHCTPVKVRVGGCGWRFPRSWRAAFLMTWDAEFRNIHRKAEPQARRLQTGARPPGGKELCCQRTYVSIALYHVVSNANLPIIV